VDTAGGGSFGLVPILEEIFWRGHVQSRLQESFTPTAAITITAIMFTFSHSQYHHLDIYHAATIAGVFASALVLGWIVHHTRSLVPAIVMHALLNVPTDGIWMYLVVGAMLAVIVLNRHKYREALRRIKTRIKQDRWSVVDSLGVLFVLAIILGLSQAPQWVMYAGYVGLPMAIVISIFLRKRQATAT
jgi:hypothetical protein